MEILTNEIEISESKNKSFFSVLGKMVASYFQDKNNQKSYEDNKAELSKEIEVLRKKKEKKNGFNEREKN